MEVLERIADRIPKEVDYLTSTHTMRDGEVRRIIKPSLAVSHITKNLTRSFSARLPYFVPDHVHGFVKGRSSITNARQHLDRDCVLRVDLRHFFPSIDAARVATALQGKGFDEDAAALCTRLTTVNGSLPIGFSTSPYLSNLVFEATDLDLSCFSLEAGLSFTRYVDDMIFSGAVEESHLLKIREILAKHRWEINDRKVRFMRRGGPQYVTGLYVGRADGPKIPRAVKRRMRWIAHMISVVGYDTYMQDFGGESEGMLPQHLLGWARYITSVEPAIGKPLLWFLKNNIPERYVNAEERFGDIDFLL